MPTRTGPTYVVARARPPKTATKDDDRPSHRRPDSKLSSKSERGGLKKGRLCVLERKSISSHLIGIFDFPNVGRDRNFFRSTAPLLLRSVCREETTHKSKPFYFKLLALDCDERHQRMPISLVTKRLVNTHGPLPIEKEVLISGDKAGALLLPVPCFQIRPKSPRHKGYPRWTIH